MKVGNYEQMMAYLKDPFNPSELRARVKELEQRESFAIGGGAFVGEELPNNREGFSKLYGPNIRKSTTSDSFEVNINRGGKNFYKTFSYGDGVGSGPKPSYATKEEALEAATKFRDSVKNLPKATGKESTGRPFGSKVKTGPSGEIRRILNQFIKEGRTSFSNEDIRKLVNKDFFSTDENLVKTIDRIKKEPEFKDLNFIVKKRDRLDYFTDPFIRETIKENYKKLKQDNLAKLIFPDEPLTTSKTRLGTILRDMADKGEIERLKVGEFSEERFKDFDPSPEAEKKARITKRRRKKIDILGSKDYEKELYDFKKEVQESLNLEKVKKGKYDPIDMGHQSSIKQLKALMQRLKPEDLSPQFYKANQLGIKKYEGGVKTLESALDRIYYPEQKKLYKQAQKFINAGKDVPEDLQNKIIKSNEDIQKFIDETVEKYPLLKNRVNAITVDPINLNVKRGDNIFRQLGMGLVDKDLGDIEIGSLDDLTIKMNLAEQTLKEAIDAGLIDEATGRQKINKFLKAEVINEYENNKAMLAKDLSVFCNTQQLNSGTGSLACSPDEITRNMKKAATTKAGKARVIRAARAAGKVFGTIVAPIDIAIETAFMAPHLLRGDVQGAIAASTAGFFGAGRDEIEEAEKEYGKDSPLYNLYQRDQAIGDMAMHINKMDMLSATLKKLIPSEGEITSFIKPDNLRPYGYSKEQTLQQALNDFIEEAQNKSKIQERFNLYAPKINTPALQFQALDQAYKLSDKIQSSGFYKPNEKGQYPLLQRLESAGIKDLQTTFTKKDIEDRYSDMKLYDTGAAPLYKDVTDRTFPYKASELAEREKSQMPSEEEIEKRFRRNLGIADPKIVEQYEQMGFPQLTPFLGYADGGRINLSNGGRLTFSDGSPKDPSKRKFLQKTAIGGGVAGGLATGLINLLDLFRGGSKVTKAQEAVRRASRAEEIFFDLVRNVKNKGVMREARFTADEPGGVIYEHAGVKVIDEEPYIRVEFETDKGAPAVIEYRKPGYDVDPETQTTIKDPGGFEYEGQEVGRIRPNGDVDIDFEEEIIDEITNVEKIAKGD